MKYAPSRTAPPSRESAPAESVPTELSELLELVRSLPPAIREELAPAVSEAIEQARFRSRVLGIAKDAIAPLRLDLELTKFDLEITRKEREELRLLAS